jgi:hypothetical protein
MALIQIYSIVIVHHPYIHQDLRGEGLLEENLAVVELSYSSFAGWLPALI